MINYKLEKATSKKDFITNSNILIIKNTELRVSYNKDSLDKNSNTIDIWRVFDGIYLGHITSFLEIDYLIVES
jgi:hypothetical protein